MLPSFILGEKEKEVRRFGMIFAPECHLRKERKRKARRFKLILPINYRKMKRRFKLIFPINYIFKSEGTEEKGKKDHHLLNERSFGN